MNKADLLPTQAGAVTFSFSAVSNEPAALVRAHKAYVQGRLAPPLGWEHALRRPG
jgi:hypothetical protein